MASLPPKRGVESSMELLCGMGSILIATYKIFPLELSELKT
ncbi:Retrotransposable element Tf2 [Senna tora]|uniref:Retrotransposable element Tf2 n=1 Tax=Senna tora TaxID=362788 RepID=A0A834XC58_9FABA|nr:Retrotransposable element Tf2 [Senna tora]